ncbi:MAG TPA: TonB-dependent hemoglobin/transferrin/lactoferrin family receptor [Burkholderiaceae bacterium]|nr:TonB-dependent hemoglobin/transferrin/lactoferrin family receptor [Burkholderiaceae bacterium]
MLHEICAALAIAMAGSTALAEPAAEPTLAETTVTATRTPRLVDDVPNTVTVIRATDIDKSGARDIKDVFRHEIDVTVRAAPGRFTAAGAATGRAGNEGINIRGLEGNQVLILVDGIRVPNAFSFGSFATGRGDFLSLDTTQAIEVLRGPASTQYGSDGLAGVVSLRTLEPADLLKNGQAAGGFVRFGQADVNDSVHATVAAARRSGDWQGLLVASRREGHELHNQGGNDAADTTRTTPNPADASATSVLGKLVHALNPQHRLGLTLEAQRSRLATEVLSARSASTLALDALDRIERKRVSLEHRYADPHGAWAQRIETHLYRQAATVSQFAAEDRSLLADRTRDNRYEQDVTGLSVLLESSFGDMWVHRLSHGLDLSRTEITGVRDGTVPPFGETFPTQPFPDTRYVLAGAFVQDEIEAGPFSVIPGLRFDQYKLKPSQAGYVGGEAVTLSDQALTPRLGVVWRLNPAFAPYGQWACGFHAPTPDQVNNGFTNVASFYRSIGNPNLKAERAESIELGARGRLGVLRWSVAGFDNRYRDFISQQVVGGSGTATDPTTYQYINLSSARIRGVEARGEWQLDPRWWVSAGSALTRGHTTAGGSVAPLDTVEPLRTVVGLRHDAGSFKFNATVLHSQAKGADRSVPIPTATGTTPAFASPAYTVLDLGMNWKPQPALSLSANLNNVFDRSYWRWSDVRGLADNSSVKDAYTAPGRNLQVSVRYDF